MRAGCIVVDFHWQTGSHVRVLEVGGWRGRVVSRGRLIVQSRMENRLLRNRGGVAVVVVPGDDAVGGHESLGMLPLFLRPLVLKPDLDTANGQTSLLGKVLPHGPRRPRVSQVHLQQQLGLGLCELGAWRPLLVLAVLAVVVLLLGLIFEVAPVIVLDHLRRRGRGRGNRRPRGRGRGMGLAGEGAGDGVEAVVLALDDGDVADGAHEALLVQDDPVEVEGLLAVDDLVLAAHALGSEPGGVVLGAEEVLAVGVPEVRGGGVVLVVEVEVAFDAPEAGLVGEDVEAVLLVLEADAAVVLDGLLAAQAGFALGIHIDC